MKRTAKMIALAAVLALCLIMTGCYVAPEDDVNNGGATNAGNNLPFQTLQPTATVTMSPDTIAVGTPNPNQGQQGQQGQNIFPDTSTPTPTPGPGGNWSDWGNTGDPNASAAPTEIPTGGTIVFVTPTPAPGTENGIQTVTGSPSPAAPTTAAPLTPTPTPKSMRLGFQGEAVRTVQKKLNDKNAKTAKQANATAKPKATATPRATATPNLQKDYYLRLGTSGAKVETLQRRLIELGWMSGKVTGNFDSATEAAVIAFQERTRGLWSDGVAGPETLRALYSSGAARSSKPVSVNSAETLQFGSEGAEVTRLQKKLQDLGYLAGYADGKFGVETQAAVIAFQQNNNLTADGKAGTATQNKLYSGTANRAGGNAVKISGNNNSGRDTDGIASTGYETLEYGSTGEAVRKLQNRLDALGYKPGYTDGKFGATTEAAVMAFQANNNLTVDGKAGPATQRVLYGSAKRSDVAYSTIRPGDTGAAVRNMQYTLYELGYYDGAIDGIYGQTTSDAVRSFQIENSLKPVDGIAGNATLSKLYSSSAVPASKAGDLYETVRPGDSGDVVVQIQDVLVSYGYLAAGNITGVYDAATEAAVRAFQEANKDKYNLKVDGICGSQTLSVLFGY